MYGRVPVARAAELVAATHDGQLLPDLLRGRSRDRRAAQAAEIFVRTERGLTGNDEVEVQSSEPIDSGVRVLLQVGDELLEVLVDEVGLDKTGHSRCSGEATPSWLRTRQLEHRLCPF